MLIHILIGKTVWMAFCAVFVIFFGLEFVFRLFDTLSHEHADYSLFDLLIVTGTALPIRLYDHLTLMVLISSAIAFGLLSRTSELTVIRAAGVSKGCLINAAIVSMSPVLVGAIVIAQFGMPQAQQLHLRLVEASSTDQPQRIWTREAQQYVAYDVTSTGQVVSRLEVQPSQESQMFDGYKVSTGGYVLENGKFGFEGTEAIEFQGGSIVREQTDHESISVSSLKTLQWLAMDPTALTLVGLWQSSTYLSNEHLNAKHHAQLFWHRILMPMSLALMVVLGATYSIGSTRQVDMGQRIFVSVLLGLAYKYVADLAGPVIYLVQWHAVLAPLIPMLLLIAFVAFFSRFR